MTSGNTLPNRPTRIDKLTLPDHPYLTEEDECYFFGEYTARGGYAYSHTNDLILNFKKGMDRRYRFEWRYKLSAIREVATAFRTALSAWFGPDLLSSLTFVPVPPSKAKDDPLHDDRMLKTLTATGLTPPLDVRELIVQSVSTEPVHLIDEPRPTPRQIADNYQLDEALTDPPPGLIVIVDDVLTTGTHFRAAQSVLRSRFQESRIIGLFIARRVPGANDINEIPGG